MWGQGRHLVEQRRAYDGPSSYQGYGPDEDHGYDFGQAGQLRSCLLVPSAMSHADCSRSVTAASTGLEWSSISPDLSPTPPIISNN